MLVVRCVQAAVCTMMTYHLAAVYPVHPVPWSGAAAAVSASLQYTSVAQSWCSTLSDTHPPTSAVIHCVLMLSDNPSPVWYFQWVNKASDWWECWLLPSALESPSVVTWQTWGLCRLMCTLYPRKIEPVAESGLLLLDLFFQMWDVRLVGVFKYKNKIYFNLT